MFTIIPEKLKSYGEEDNLSEIYTACKANKSQLGLTHELDLQPSSYIEPIYVEETGLFFDENTWKTSYDITCKNTYKFTGLKPMRSHRVTMLYGRYNIY